MKHGRKVICRCSLQNILTVIWLAKMEGKSMAREPVPHAASHEPCHDVPLQHAPVRGAGGLESGIDQMSHSPRMWAIERMLPWCGSAKGPPSAHHLHDHAPEKLRARQPAEHWHCSRWLNLQHHPWE